MSGLGLKRSNAFIGDPNQQPANPAPAGQPSATSLFGNNQNSQVPKVNIFGSTPNQGAGQGQQGSTPSLFGQNGANQQKPGGLFGQTPSAPAQGTPLGQQPGQPSMFGNKDNAGGAPSLFGGSNQGQKPAGGIFASAQPGQPSFFSGQPGGGANPSLQGATGQAPMFGQPNPQTQQPGQPSLFGPTPQAQQQQQQLGGLAAQGVNFISFLEAHTRAIPLKSISDRHYTLSLNNQYARKRVEMLPGGDQTVQMAFQVENKLSEQAQDLSEIQKMMKELKGEHEQLRSELVDTCDLTQKQSQRVSQIKLQIEAMEAELRKNQTYQSQLDQVIDDYNDENKQIEVPFQFFYDLYREQERDVIKLASRVDEAENLANQLLQETKQKQRDTAHGDLIDSDLTQGSLRDKIFQVCSLLYEQQKKAGLSLAILERKVAKARQDFTQAVLMKRDWETKESIDKLFERSTPIDLNNQLGSIQKQQFETTLSKEFSDSLKLMQSKQKPAAGSHTPKLQAQSSAGGSLTERLHRGTQASIMMRRRQVSGPSQVLGPHFVDDAQDSNHHVRLGKRSFYGSHQDEIWDGEEHLGRQGDFVRPSPNHFAHPIMKRRSRVSYQEEPAYGSMRYAGTLKQPRLGGSIYQKSPGASHFYDGGRSYLANFSADRGNSFSTNTSSMFFREGNASTQMSKRGRNPLF